MTKRIFDFEAYPCPDPRVMAWIEANGLDPNLIPVAFPAVIEGDKLTVTEFILEQSDPNKPPHKAVSTDGSGFKKTQRTVPLLSAPEDHGL